MSTNNTTSLATVADITGNVWGLTADGRKHLLRVGDAVYEGEVILTEAGSIVVLRNANGADLKVTEGKEVTLRDGLFDGAENTFTLDLRGLIFATNGAPYAGSNVSLEAGAAHADPVTFTAGNAAGLQTPHGFIDVERIVESIIPPAYQFWSFTGRYNSSNNQFRSANFDPLLDGRATQDERIVMPLEIGRAHV